MPLYVAKVIESMAMPKICVSQVESISDAIDFVNSRPKPLVLYLFTNDANVKRRVRDETSTGSLVVNEVCLQVSYQTNVYVDAMIIYFVNEQVIEYC